MKLIIPIALVLLILAGCKTQQISIKPTEQKVENNELSTALLLSNSWKLQVKNLDNKVITTLQIRFSNEEAKSCMGGDWNKIVIESYETSDERFFPVKDELSYQVEGNSLTIGRNQICDAYLHLSADLSDLMKGDYYSVGKGGKYPLGTFKLSTK